MRLHAFLYSFFLAFLAVSSDRAFSQEMESRTLQAVLQPHQKDIVRASSRTVDVILDDILNANLPQARTFLERWQRKEVWFAQQEGKFYFLKDRSTDPFVFVDIDDEKLVLSFSKLAVTQLKPNSGVRGKIAGRLVLFQLADPDPDIRVSALEVVERQLEESHIPILARALSVETDASLKTRIERLLQFAIIQFATDTKKRVAAIRTFSGDTSVDVRKVITPLLETKMILEERLVGNANISLKLSPGSDISLAEAYQLLVNEEVAPPLVTKEFRDKALLNHVNHGMVAGQHVAQLNSEQSRDRAYDQLAFNGLVPERVNDEQQKEYLASHPIVEVYVETDPEVTAAAKDLLDGLEQKVAFYKSLDLILDSVSLASIYFLAAIGLAITFGVMGIINMAHGEFIMMGAYTGYVVQQLIPDYTISLIVALPLAFVVAGLAGILLERLVIRHLRHRPLETLLATFGVSIALQQLAKNIFGTQARPLTAPSWLDGSLFINDVISISLIRIAIFVLAALFLFVLFYVLRRTRFGLEIRAVTQNARMASSVGINTDRINMLTFALGSGIAGVAGVAIGLFAQVTSEIGSAYIVQSFMTVVVGGVGSIWGTLSGAGMIGIFQKIIEFLNPSNTLAAQTYMIMFIIIFIQFRPKGIIALKGRAAGD